MRNSLGLAYHPFSFLHTGWKHRSLIRRLTVRRVEADYRGSVLGLVWTLLHPLLLLSVYTFVFSVIFRARWDGAGKLEVALLVFSGLILYTVFSKCVNEAPSLMISHQTYIKQVVFPAEVLAWVCVLAALFDFAVGGILLAALYAVALGPPPLTCLLLPLVVCPALLLTLGAVWLLSSLGVFLRDISQVVGVLTTALLLLSPIFYPASRVPEWLQAYYAWNPFTVIIEMFRASLFSGTPPDWRVWGALMAATWGVAWLGYAWFMKTKSGFADVL